ncbi:MAG: F0F1 ATP synthase subunit A [Paludibacteraceae bacterium]|nr:F0F1 ATP synthase subunit A [Paludibacteraceae bacterium]
MNKKFFTILLLLFVCLGLWANEKESTPKVDVKSVIFDHISDAYEWHITTIGEKHITIPLPIIVYGETNGFKVFMSSQLHHHDSYCGYQYGAKEGKYAGKIVELNARGEEVRPWDFSLTKNAVAIIINCILLAVVILWVASWYKKKPMEAPKGFRGALEMLIMSIQDDLIKPCIGKDYRKYSPYLLTAFFFIFFNNLMGLIPLFPGGANTTGNIAVTLVLALFTFFAVNIFGTKEYWKEILWPDVPIWMKAIPLMPIIELFGIFTKPFALMIRLFANIMAGHSIVLGLTCLVFITASMGAAVCAGMTFVSVFFTIFMDCLELLVAYIQAYVFTMLSSVFIGLSKVEHHS